MVHLKYDCWPWLSPYEFYFVISKQRTKGGIDRGHVRGSYGYNFREIKSVLGMCRIKGSDILYKPNDLYGDGTEYI